ncbi:hypothetical protein J6590_020638 [Homalodisca vitripennis]|nr:hypothetical protein J6590_020638 [Homalodisca vitripennis]
MERRSDTTLEESDYSTILLWSFSYPDANSTFSHVQHKLILRQSQRIHTLEYHRMVEDLSQLTLTPIGQGISFFIPMDPLMTKNPTNSHIVDSGKGRNDLIAIPDKFGFEHTRVQCHQCCLTICENIDRLTPISQTNILTSTFHNTIPAPVPFFVLEPSVNRSSSAGGKA